MDLHIHDLDAFFLPREGFFCSIYSTSPAFLFPFSISFEFCSSIFAMLVHLAMHCPSG